MDEQISVVPQVTLDVWIQLIIYLLVGGVFSTLGNLHLLLAIANSKRLRSRFFVILTALLICRLLEGAQFACMAMYRVLRILRVVSLIQTRLTCISLGFFLYTGVTLELLLLLVLAIDRGIALFFPMQYRQLSRSSATRICLLMYILAIILKQIPVYLGVDLWQDILCMSVFSGPHPIYYKYAAYLDLILTIFILTTYLVIMIFLHRRLKALRTTCRNDAILQSVRRQMKLLPTLRNVILVHCALTITSRSVLLGVAETNDETQAFHLTVYGGILTVVDLFVNVIVLVCTNADIRKAAFECCTRRFTDVYIVNSESGISY